MEDSSAMNWLTEQLPKLSANDKRELNERGCLVLAERIPSQLLDELRNAVDQLFDQEGPQAGSEFKQEEGCLRLANLVNKGNVFADVIAYPPMLSAIAEVLQNNFKLSSLNARSANPHNGIRQPLHCDMGAVPDEKGYWVCNAVWMLDDFTEKNGATRFLPGSHREKQLPQDQLASLLDFDERSELLTGAAGTVAIMNAHLWHGGMENATDTRRRALHAFFARRDRPQQQYQKQLVDVARQQQLSPLQRWLLALDDPLNDSLSANPEQRSGFLE